MTDDGGEQGVIEQRDGRSRTDVRLNHGIVDLGLVEETTEFVVVVFPNDVNVVLTVDVDGWPISVLRAALDDGIVNGGDGSVVGSHAVHRCRPWRESRVHDGVLARFVGPNHVKAIKLINGDVGVPNLVKSRVGDLG